MGADPRSASAAADMPSDVIPTPVMPPCAAAAIADRAARRAARITAARRSAGTNSRAAISCRNASPGGSAGDPDRRSCATRAAAVASGCPRNDTATSVSTSGANREGSGATGLSCCTRRATSKPAEKLRMSPDPSQKPQCARGGTLAEVANPRIALRSPKLPPSRRSSSFGEAGSALTNLGSTAATPAAL